VVETQGLGHTVLDALVLALLLGILWRHVLGVPACARPGILFTGKYVLDENAMLIAVRVLRPLVTTRAVGVTLVLLDLMVWSALGRLWVIRAPRTSVKESLRNKVCHQASC
jgi:uncharacterized membrane protein YadS